MADPRRSRIAPDEWEQLHSPGETMRFVTGCLAQHLPAGQHFGMGTRGDWYETRVAEVAPRYEAISAADVNRWLIDLLPARPASVLDVGAGTGRDAAWLLSLGYEVLAVDPSAEMRADAIGRHPELDNRYLHEGLPALKKTIRNGFSFDFILLNASWMHVAPSDRRRAFRKLVTLLKPGGVIAFTLRDPVEADRSMHEVSAEEIERLARQHGAFVELRCDGSDLLDRIGVGWKHLAVRVPDDGTGALPLIRHIILNDDKSSTYKLALLRTLCRIADGAAGWAKEGTEDHVDLPLGLVALFWIRLFKPLLTPGRMLPQTPRNQYFSGLSFVKPNGFQKLTGVSDNDLRVGMRFADDVRKALDSALRHASSTIVDMPVKHLTYQDGSQILLAVRKQAPHAPACLRLDACYLWSFGTLSLPHHLWRAFQRYNVWIEPALVSEWKRLMHRYAHRQGRQIKESALTQATIWSEPVRAARIPSSQALRVIDQGPLYCVWSGRRLKKANLDIDHCFPWSAWPCSDLWNLLPVHRDVNQKMKRERLPTDFVLRQAKDRIMGWWDTGYIRSDNRVLADQFSLEASATLPTLEGPTEDPEDVFSALSLQRLRLSNDQQIPEWNGVRS